MIGAKNLNAWIKKSDAAKKQVKTKATHFVQAKVKQVLKDALTVSPQWSGNMAVNWFIETNQTGSAGEIGKFKVTPWQKLQNPWTAKKAGDQEAVHYNLQYLNTDTIASLKWNSRIRLVNYTEAAEKIEAGQVKLRPENYIPGGVGVLAYLKAKYKFVE